MYRIRCLLLKELAQLRRDRRLFGMLLISPLLQLFVLGHAANTDLRNISLGIRDNDRSFYSREFTRQLSSSDYFRVTLLTGPREQDAALLISGKQGLILEIPPQFGQKLSNRESAPVQVLVDGADSNFGVQGMAFLNKAARMFSERVAAVPGTNPGLEFPISSVSARTRIWFNPDLKSAWYLAPAIMAMVLMVTTMIVTSMALVKEREQGTLEQLIVTPLRPAEVIIAKLLPFVLIGFVVVTLAVPVIIFEFDVPMLGSMLLLYGMSGLFLMNTLGLGLFVSTLVKTQQQAMMFATFFVTMPFVMLSGFAFPVENMPAPIQAIAHVIPLKYFLTAIRGIFLKGNGIAELWREAAVLLIWGVGILSLAALRFRKRLD